MTASFWANDPFWTAFKRVDEEFDARWNADPEALPVKPVERNVRLRILLYAGRQAAAAFRIACGKKLHPEEARIAEEATLYEPFDYFDWHGYDADGRSDLERASLKWRGKGQRTGEDWDPTSVDEDGCDVAERKRKRRVLWERERAFRVSAASEPGAVRTSPVYRDPEAGVWALCPSPRDRWEGFKRAVERRRGAGRCVKRLAVASWMGKEDLRWIARNLSRLEALDLSDVPVSHDANDAEWNWSLIEGLKEVSAIHPAYIDNLFDTFPYLDEDEQVKRVEEGRLEGLYKNRTDYGYRQLGPIEQYKQHPLMKAKDVPLNETFEEFFWRLLAEQEENDAKDSREPSNKLRELEETIAESHFWRRLKWLGLPDWRAPGHTAKEVCAAIPSWCVSLETVSIRGSYTRDRAAHEVPSVHHHVCQLILGISRFVPTSVTTLELRLSVSFLRYFLDQLQRLKPSIQRVGIDLGAWVHVFPLGKPSARLEDGNIRRAVRGFAREASDHPEFKIRGPGGNLSDYSEKQIRNGHSQDYNGEQEWLARLPNFYRDRSGDYSAYRTLEGGHPLGEYPPTTIGGEEKGEGYDFFKDFGADEAKTKCPLDSSERHAHTWSELNKTRADTLPELLEKLHLARKRDEGVRSSLNNFNYRNGKPTIEVVRRGAVLFGLEGETQSRSFDPLHPLTLTQMDSKTDFKAGRDYEGLTPDNLKAVYPWVEKTFKWRPVFDWDWFMVPRNMVATANPNLVTIDEPSHWQLLGPRRPAKALAAALAAIKRQFELLNEAQIPVHLLIGRRDPDVSSCYWGWPYNEDAWKQWEEEDFSANLETIAEHVNVLSIFYDLRNPLDQDRLWLIQEKRPQFPPRANCPMRVCPWESTRKEKCPIVKDNPVLRNKHPRPQVQGRRKPQKMANKQGLTERKSYDSLAGGSSSAPPTGENANDYADDDSEDEISMSPFMLARRSVFARETLGWQRFWKAYATSFTRIDALHVRMPNFHDRIGSWRLARLLNKNHGWTMIPYTDERQHIQTEDDLLRTYESRPIPTPSSVYLHKKESRVWPAGRFVRRSWIREPLRIEEAWTYIFADPDPYGDPDAPRKILGKRYTTLRWDPRPRVDLTSEDTNVTAGEAQTLADAQREVHASLVAEHEACSRAGIPPPQAPLGPTSAYAHHVRNVAGNQWREELREMIAYAEARIVRLSASLIPDGGEPEKRFREEKAKLESLLAEEVPYGTFFEWEGEDVKLKEAPNKLDSPGRSTESPGNNEDDDGGQTGKEGGASKGKEKPDKGSKEPHASAGPETDEDSLFADNEAEKESASQTLRKHTSSSRRPSSEHRTSSKRKSSHLKKPPSMKKGPLLQSSSSSSSDDDATDDPSILSNPVPVLPPPPSVVGANDDDGAPTDPDAVYTSAEDASSPQQRLTEKLDAAEKNVAGAKEALATVAGGMATGEAGPSPSSGNKRKRGRPPKQSPSVEDAASSPTRHKSPRKSASAPDIVEPVSPEPASPEPSTSLKRKEPAAPEDAGPNKKAKTKEKEKAEDTREQPSSDPAEEPSTTLKRKEPAAVEDAAPSKKARTKGKEGVEDTYEQSSQSSSDPSEEEDPGPAPPVKKRGRPAKSARPAAATPGPITVPTNADGSPNYDRLTVVQLRQLAKQRGVSLTWAMRKAAIVTKFLEDDASRAVGGDGDGGDGDGGDGDGDGENT